MVDVLEEDVAPARGISFLAAADRRADREGASDAGALIAAEGTSIALSVDREGPVGQEAFAVIREAMRGKAMVALGRVVLAKRERVIMLQPWEKGHEGFCGRSWRG